MIAIIDYGAGNLHSVANALTNIGAEYVITSGKSEILSADKIILPGVGAFADAMNGLKSMGLDKIIKEAVSLNKPILGICLGLQLLFEESEEGEGVQGLGVLKGKIVKIPDHGLKIPHIGWNNIILTKESKLLKDLGNEPYVYFVHSYYLKASDEDVVSAYTEYGERLDIAIEKGNIYATQFHPEKSGDTGIKILKNFVEI